MPERVRPSVRALPSPDPTFADLYRESHADMVRLAYLLTGSAETAQDLVQDAFVSVHRSWSRVREPRAYLRRAVVNACTSHHRRGFRAKRETETMVPGVETGAPDELFDVLARLSPRGACRSCPALLARPRRSGHRRRGRVPARNRRLTLASPLAQLREALEQ